MYTLIITHETGMFKGVAFVTMGDVDQATTACEKLNAAAFQGRKLRVNMATSRRQ